MQFIQANLLARIPLGSLETINKCIACCSKPGSDDWTDWKSQQEARCYEDKVDQCQYERSSVLWMHVYIVLGEKKNECMIIRHAKYPSLQKKTYPWVPKIATTIAIMNSASAPHATTTSPQIENRQAVLAFWPSCMPSCTCRSERMVNDPSNVECRIHPVQPRDGNSFCFVAKIPKEITAVNRTVKYTTAMMQWNKRDRPFCNSFDRFCFGGAAGVGASIFQV